MTTVQVAFSETPEPVYDNALAIFLEVEKSSGLADTPIGAAHLDRPPFTLEVMTPQSWSLSSLRERVRSKSPAFAGLINSSQTPSTKRLVLCHSCSVFPVQRASAPSIWAISYSAHFPGALEQVRTVGYFPKAETQTLGRAKHEVTAVMDGSGNLSAQGGLELEDVADATADGRVKIGVSSKNKVQWTLSLNISQLRVMAGTFGGNGVRWDHYRSINDQIPSESFVQVVDVPVQMVTLTMEIRCWAIGRSWWGGKGQVVEWAGSNNPLVLSVATD
jgi:hypothetical protein